MNLKKTNHVIAGLLFLILVAYILWPNAQKEKKSVATDSLENSFQKEKLKWNDFISKGEKINIQGDELPMQTEAAPLDFIEQYESEFGASDQGKFKGNVYIDKGHKILFSLKNPEIWNGVVLQNERLMQDPDGAIARLHFGDSITFEVHEGNFSEVFDIETYTRTIYLPSYLPDTSLFPPITYKYDQQVAWFNLWLNTFRLQGEIKILMDSKRAIVGRLRYPKGKEKDKRVKELRYSLATLTRIPK